MPNGKISLLNIKTIEGWFFPLFQVESVTCDFRSTRSIYYKWFRFGQSQTTTNWFCWIFRQQSATEWKYLLVWFVEHSHIDDSSKKANFFDAKGKMPAHKDFNYYWKCSKNPISVGVKWLSSEQSIHRLAVVVICIDSAHLNCAPQIIKLIVSNSVALLSAAGYQAGTTNETNNNKVSEWKCSQSSEDRRALFVKHPNRLIIILSERKARINV